MYVDDRFQSFEAFDQNNWTHSTVNIKMRIIIIVSLVLFWAAAIDGECFKILQKLIIVFLSKMV